MKSLQEQLKRLRDILNSTSGKGRIYHYTRPKDIAKHWVTWQEDGEGESSDADNVKTYQQVHGTIDLFTRTEYDPLVDEIQEALNAAEHVGWVLNSVQYEDETNLIHYEWGFNIG